jgi:hypothetical protein
LVPGKVSKFAEFGRIWRYSLGSASVQKRVKQGHFFHFSVLRHHDVRSRKAVQTAFWNLAVSGKVSFSAEFGIVLAYSVGTAGAPKRAEQGFRCKKSTKSAISLRKVCIIHT